MLEGMENRGANGEEVVEVVWLRKQAEAHTLLGNKLTNIARRMKANARNKEDPTKCQLLTVSRHEYKTLAEERCQVNVNFCHTVVDPQRVEALPERGVPQQFIECAVQMPEVERYSATRAGPGTIRDPLEAGQPDDDGSDELSDESGEECYVWVSNYGSLEENFYPTTLANFNDISNTFIPIQAHANTSKHI